MTALTLDERRDANDRIEELRFQLVQANARADALEKRVMHSESMNADLHTQINDIANILGCANWEVHRIYGAIEAIQHLARNPR